MAVRARADNLALDHPGTDAAAIDFQELWEHRDDLRTVCRRLVGEDGRADDVVQETFLRALTNAKRLDRRISFAPWLATVARRRSIDALRAEARVRPMAAPPDRAGDTGDDPLEEVLRQERFERVRSALAELSVRERQLLLRQVTHGMSLADLAEEEATSIASVRSVLSRARTKLRTSLERGGPLGAAPVPGLVAAVKRRLHRWAVRLEGGAPLFVGAGAQFGDAVMAAVVAVVLLLAGSAPSAEPSQLVAALGDRAQATERHARQDDGDKAAEHGPKKSTTTTTSTSTTAPPSAWSPFDASPSDVVAVPGIPDSRAGQPDDAIIDGFAVGGDGDTVLAWGAANGAAWIYRSQDSGHSWTRLRSVNYLGGTLLVPPTYPTKPTIFEVRADFFLQRSNDGGGEFIPAVTASRGAATLLPATGPDVPDVLLTTPQLLRYRTAEGASTPVGVGPSTSTLSSLAVMPDYPTNPVALIGSSASSTVLVGKRTGVVHRCTAVECSQAVLTGSDWAPLLHASSAVPGLVLAHAPGSLHRSTDGGVTFSQVTLPAGVRINQVTEDSGGELLLASLGTSSTGAGLYRSSDDGQTWTAMSTGTALDQGALSVIRLATGRIIASVGFGTGLFCSDDGSTWAPRCS